MDNFYIIATSKGLEKYGIIVNAAVILQETYFRLNEGKCDELLEGKEGKLYPLS